MVSIESTQAPRVPAWKRLGLKLANQGEPKKRKVEEISPQPQLQNASKRKKSVTFAEDVKVDDGSHIEKMMKNFVGEQRGGSEQFTPREVAKFSISASHPANGGSSKKVASTKLHKDTPNPVSQEDPETPQQPEYLRYLIQFGRDKKNWKFKKHDQILLLKYTFSERRIPSEYFPYFLEYIDGLQGQARVRLAERARAVVDEPAIEAENSEEETIKRANKKTVNKKADEKMEDPQVRREARDVAMKKQLLDTKIRLREAADDDALGSEQFRKKYTKRKRGEEILRLLADVSASLGVPVKDIANSSVAPTNQVINARSLANPGQSKRLRIRKARTGLPEDDLSSVSSVELDSESEGVKVDKKAVKKAKPTADSSSDSSGVSSSEDSSSSEDTDSDSDSDSGTDGSSSSGS